MTEFTKKHWVLSLAEVFESLTLDKRYDYLENLGLPQFVVQTVEINGGAEDAAENIYEYLSINAPEYLNLFQPSK